MIDHMPDVIFRVRLVPHPRLDYISRSVLAVTGYAPEEWRRDPALATRLIHPLDRRRLLDIPRSKSLEARPLTLRWTRRDGSVLWTELRGTPVYSRNGTMVAIEAIARDVTATRVAREAGRGDRASLRTIFEQAPCGLARVAVDGRFLHVNARMCEITGYSRDDLLVRRFHDITHPDDVDRDAALLQRVVAGELSRYAVEKRYVRKDSATAWVRVNVSFVRNRAGTPVYGVAIIDEVSPRDPLEAAREPMLYMGIELDAERLEVRYNSRPVPLTLKEILLLRYLIRHRGEMLPRERLVRDVWGYKYSGRSRTLDVHVCRLRRKLPPLADSLITIGHFGYTLSAAAPGAGIVGVLGPKVS
jgi:PAS domain S-box-containing protein